ncbi:putative lGFP repeat protein [Mycobacterium xenopi 4042]|uniref:Putative lGFP repeat protein n=1 Tax=Mycobacterium xenopi 4042 TaxID=1299334 RepID=X8DJ04_MYCXE|nr:putative lGFP repeat protein [Mycobacterium xenopi 4042]
MPRSTRGRCTGRRRPVPSLSPAPSTKLGPHWDTSVARWVAHQREIQEPQWVKQNFQHGTLNFDRESGTVIRVIDGVAEQLPPPAPNGPPVQLERFTRPISPPH